MDILLIVVKPPEKGAAVLASGIRFVKGRK
jgi:hypothetical protein